MKLYHACAAEHLDAILSEGLREGTYLTDDEDVATYYAETIEDEDKVPEIVELDLDDLIAIVGEAALGVDRESVAEPLCHTLRTTEDAVAAAWAACEGTWRDSLEIVRSIRVAAPIPASLLSRSVPEPGPI